MLSIEIQVTDVTYITHDEDGVDFVVGTPDGLAQGISLVNSERYATTTTYYDGASRPFAVTISGANQYVALFMSATSYKHLASIVSEAGVRLPVAEDVPMPLARPSSL